MATIQKRGNSYKITVSCGYDTRNKQIRKTMTWTPPANMTPRQEQKELERQTVLFEEQCANGLYLNGNIKFADFSQHWLEDYAEKQLKAKTIERYKSLLERINVAIGHIRLDRLQPKHLIQFYDNLSENGIRNDNTYILTEDINKIIKDRKITKVKLSELTGISQTTIRTACRGIAVSEKTAASIATALDIPLKSLFKPSNDTPHTLSDKTVLHHHRLISSILTTAVQWQVILSNPCDRVKPPKVERKEARYLDDEQTAELFDCLQSEPLKYKTMVTVLIYTGMRRGELCGLKWSDIDFKNKIINIQRATLYLPNKGIFEDTTKNNSSQRVIKVSDVVISALKAYKKQQDIDRFGIGDKWVDTGYIFTTWNGKPIHPDTLTGWFHDFIKRNNLPDVCIHSLRHTNATLLIANGVNLTTVAKRLGHANTNTTTKIYAHAIKTADEIAADTLQDILNKSSKQMYS